MCYHRHSMKLVIFDIDGVLLRGRQPIPHAVATISWLKDNGLITTYLTNNSTQEPSVFADRLNNVGIHAQVDQIMTSSLATASYLDEKPGECRNAYVVGENGIIKALESKGFKVVNNYPDTHARYVVVGMDRQFSYNKLARAQYEILFNGAGFIATNYDPIFPVENNRVKPGGGVMVRAIEACTNRNAVIIGKPEPTGIVQLMKKFDAQPHETIIVGDNLDTDILAGKRAGIGTVFVLTGIHNQKDLMTKNLKQVPDYIIKDLSNLKDCLN